MEKEPISHNPVGYENWTIEQKIANTTYIGCVQEILPDGSLGEPRAIKLKPYKTAEQPVQPPASD